MLLAIDVCRLVKEPLGFAGNPQKVSLLAGFVLGHRTHSLGFLKAEPA